jgi:hypothetical protein
MQYFNRDFFKMSIGFLLLIGLGLAGVYLANREEVKAIPKAQLTDKQK